jgi:hypothetical protein
MLTYGVWAMEQFLYSDDGVCAMSEPPKVNWQLK